MSVVPSSASSVQGSYYFPLATGGTLKGPTINPIGPSVAAGTLEIRNYDLYTTDVSNSTRVIHYMTNAPGGGLEPNAYQLFMYGVAVGGNGIAECSKISPAGNNRALMAFNNDGPLEGDRMATITGTGSAQSVACLSILSTSLVRLAFVAGTPAGANPAVTITPGVGFSLTLPAGAVYNYEIVG